MTENFANRAMALALMLSTVLPIMNADANATEVGINKKRSIVHSCKAGFWAVKNRGFIHVRTIDCSGPVYRYSGKKGNRDPGIYWIFFDARTKEIQESAALFRNRRPIDAGRL